MLVAVQYANVLRRCKFATLQTAALDTRPVTAVFPDSQGTHVLSLTYITLKMLFNNQTWPSGP